MECGCCGGEDRGDLDGKKKGSGIESRLVCARRGLDDAVVLMQSNVELGSTGQGNGTRIA